MHTRRRHIRRRVPAHVRRERREAVFWGAMCVVTITPILGLFLYAAFLQIERGI